MLVEAVNSACIYDMIVVEPVAAYNARRSAPEPKPMPLIDIDREMISFIGCACYPPRFMSVINQLAQTRDFTKRSDREEFKRVAIASLGRLVRQRVVERYKRKFVRMPGASFRTNRGELAKGHGRLL